jgi:hypothetical protein
MNASGNTGPPGRSRGIGFGILMFIVTLHFYSWYWVFKTQEEIKQHTGEGLGGVTDGFRAKYGRCAENQMPQLEVTLEPIAPKAVVPGDVGLRATIRNPGDSPAPFHTHQARNPSLVHELRDDRDQPIFLPPPTPPGERDLAPPDKIQPRESVAIEYVGFLEVGLASGRYRVRFFSPHPVLGGTREEPLTSEWVTFTVATPEIPAGRAVGVPTVSYHPTRFLWLCQRW